MGPPTDRLSTMILETLSPLQICNHNPCRNFYMSEMYVKCQKILGGFQGFRGMLKIVRKIQGEYIRRSFRVSGGGPTEECPNKISKIFF